MCMEKIHINLSTSVLILAGFLILVGLIPFAGGSLYLWITAKVLYGIGVVLFLFDK